MEAELVRLAAGGQVSIADDRIVIMNAAPSGDAELDTELARMGELASAPRPEEWVGRPRARIRGRYLEQLEAAGVIRAGTRLRGTWWRVTDVSRLGEARERLDVIAGSAGGVDVCQAAYAGLVCAIGLDSRLYRGRARRAGRDRLREVAGGRWTAVGDPEGEEAAGSAAVLAAVDAAAQAAVRAATRAVAGATAGAAGAGGHG
jgi:hypothetical protein